MALALADAQETIMETPQIVQPTFPRLDLELPRPVGRVRRLRRRVVITGIGVVAPSGVGTDAMWSLLTSGRSAVRPVEGFDTSGYPVRVAAQVPDFHPRDFMTASQARRLGRFCQLALAAARLATTEAGLAGGLLATPRAGVFLGTGAGPASAWWENGDAFMRSGYRRVHPAFPVLASPHSAASQTASEFGITGPISTISSECPSGLDALVAAQDRIRAGEIDVALAGAVDAPVCRLLFAALAHSGMLAPGDDDPERTCRPFDRTRRGFVLGEAGVVLVVEDAERALARGATILGEVMGAGAGRDRPTYIGDTDPSGQGFLRAATTALRRARLAPSELGHVNAHAPGVQTTDLAEIRALHALLGAARRRVPVTSIKGALGQPLAAAGVLQVVTALMALRHRVLPATANLQEPDRECDLDVVGRAVRPVSAAPALVTSHGFGGNTTSIVVGAFDRECPRA
jgi:3-oxoacyl-(acyl-carrier-protein) synthase